MMRLVLMILGTLALVACDGGGARIPRAINPGHPVGGIDVRFVSEDTLRQFYPATLDPRLRDAVAITDHQRHEQWYSLPDWALRDQRVMALLAWHSSNVVHETLHLVERQWPDCWRRIGAAMDDPEHFRVVSDEQVRDGFLP